MLLQQCCYYYCYFFYCSTSCQWISDSVTFFLYWAMKAEAFMSMAGSPTPHLPLSSSLRHTFHPIAPSSSQYPSLCLPLDLNMLNTDMNEVDFFCFPAMMFLSISVLIMIKNTKSLILYVWKLKELCWRMKKRGCVIYRGRKESGLRRQKWGNLIQVTGKTGNSKGRTK